MVCFFFYMQRWNQINIECVNTSEVFRWSFCHLWLTVPNRSPWCDRIHRPYYTPCAGPLIEKETQQFLEKVEGNKSRRDQSMSRADVNPAAIIPALKKKKRKILNYTRCSYYSHCSCYFQPEQRQQQQRFPVGVCLTAGLPSPSPCSRSCCSSCRWRMWKGSSRTPWSRPLLCSHRVWEGMKRRITLADDHKAVVCFIPV